MITQADHAPAWRMSLDLNPRSGVGRAFTTGLRDGGLT